MRGILYYFSGTGNTKWVADKLKQKFKKNNIDLNLKSIEHTEEIEIEEYDFLMIGTPVYAEVYPKLVDDFIKKINKSKSNMRTIVYSTQGAKSAAATTLLKSELKNKDYNVEIEAAIQMPNNYYFAVGKKPSNENMLEIMNNAEKQVEYIVEKFKKNESYKMHASIIRVALAKIVGKGLMKALPKMSKNIASTYECTKCGICLRNCPKGNITFENGHAVFHSKCIMCLRCIHACPINVIRYKGKIIEQTQKNIIKCLELK